MKQFKRQSPIMFFALMLVLFFSGSALADENFLGDGTEFFPFFLSSSEDLMALSDILSTLNYTSEQWLLYNSAYYRLTDNINMNGYDWAPIGDSVLRIFLGNFNGAGYTISNLTTISTNGTPKGLFGYFGGNAHDFTLENVNFQGNSSATASGVGGVAGALFTNGMIENVNVTGTLTNITGTNVGGIVGIVTGSNARISDCTFVGSIVGETSGTDFLGGIVGRVATTGLTVENCYSGGSITRPGAGNYNIGKIAGGDEGDPFFNNTTFIKDTTSMTIDAATYGDGTFYGYDGTEVDPALLTKLGVVYNDGAVVVKNAKRLAVATLWFTAESGTPSYTELNNFAVLDEAEVGDQYRVTLGYLVSGGEGFTSENAGILKISGVAGVEIKNAKFVSYDENGNAVEVDSNVVKDTTGGVILPPGDDPTQVVNYDLNNDKVVDQLDLAIALKYFTTDDSTADFNKDGTVDIEDFIMLLNHITAW